MGLHGELTLVCDREGCEVTVTGLLAPQTPPGWTEDRGKRFCPRHEFVPADRAAEAVEAEAHQEHVRRARGA